MDLTNVLTMLVYALIIVGALLAQHFGFMDEMLVSGIVGACLAHMGINFVPTPSSTQAVIKALAPGITKPPEVVVKTEPPPTPTIQQNGGV